MKLSFPCALSLVIAWHLISCGDDGETASSTELTIATITPIRGDTRIGEETRLTHITRLQAGVVVDTGSEGLSWYESDLGPVALLDRATRTETSAPDQLSLVTGRMFVRAGRTEEFEIAVGDARFRLADASMSIEANDQETSAYVVNGEIAFARGEQRLVARAGEILRATSDGVQVEPAALWADWTGGLGRAGPNSEPPAGIGSLVARVPDEVGEARWPLVVRRLDVRVAVDQDLAITEVDQVFFNPASESVEGLYRIRVPENAILQRFSVDRDGTLVDGYIKERRQAQRQYEAQVYRGSIEDPALLEWDAPGSYRARIYPIPAGATRRIVVRYAEWLSRPTASEPRLYRFPMGGSGDLATIQEFSFLANLENAGANRFRTSHLARSEDFTVTLRESDFRPQSDLIIELYDGGTASTQSAWRASHRAPRRTPGSPPPAAEANESDYWYLPLRLPMDLVPEELSAGLDLVIVADVSAGTDASHLELGRSVVEALTAHLRPEDRVVIAASDLTLRSLDEDEPALAPATPERIEAMLDRLARTPGGGASDLGRVIADAASLLDPRRPGAVVYIGDALPTVGEMQGGGLLEHLARLPTPIRLYGIAVGNEANLDLLSALTTGSGLSLRVTERGEAARAALRIFTHAEQPVAHRVAVELGSDLEAVFPRTESSVVVGATLPIVARIQGEPPDRVTVRGQIAGREFEHSISIHTNSIEDHGDLRLRWAGERLRQLLIEGAGREEVADLGIRYGLITPYTSFYVPSRRELEQWGPYSEAWINQPMLLEPNETHRPWFRDTVEFAAMLPFMPFLVGGCDFGSSEREARIPTEQYQEEVPPTSEATGALPTDTTTAHPDLPEMSPSPAAPPIEALVEADDTEEQEGAWDQRGTSTRASPDEPVSQDAPEAAPAEPRTLRSAGERNAGYGGSTIDQQQGDFAQFLPRAEGYQDGNSALTESNRIFGRLSLEGRIRVDILQQITIDLTEHRPHRCSDGARVSLSDREVLWRERLEQSSSPSHWIEVYRAAYRKCELPTWRDRRALLDLILRHAGSVRAMLAVYHSFGTSSTRAYLRNAIRRHARAPEDLRLVREAFGLSEAVEWAMIEQMLQRAATPTAQIRILRRLIAQYPNHFELQLRLLEKLEQANRLPEAKRLAAQLRRNPLADAGIRTAIGELYLRLGDEAEARRVFSEIVEFAPHDDLARRRLGDLYRAHGWFEDAYRQYETLAQIRPDSLDALLLLAQAAAGAGRVDEALRLEQRLIQTSEPGAEYGIARTALLWSSVRYALLRKAARDDNDAEKLEALSTQMRRGGILREAGAFRASLIWSHPDADLSLWAAHPRLGLSRPPDLAPEFGIEAFDVRDSEQGTYRLEVRRAGQDHRTAIDAKLVLVWSEGEEDEHIEVIPLHFEGDQRARAWTVDGRQIAEAQVQGAGRTR